MIRRKYVQTAMALVVLVDSADEMTDGDPIAKLNALARVLNWQTRADETLSFRQPELIALREIWSGLAPDIRLPARAALTARMLKPFLPHIAVMQILSLNAGKKRLVHRYVGTAITRRFGELTGLTLEDFLPAARLPATKAFLEAVIETRRALRIITHFQLETVNYLYGEVLAVPLADDGVTPDKLMTAAYFSSDGGLAAEIQKR